MEAISNLPLPDAFLEFLNENGIDPSIYTATDSTPRYIRLKPGCEEQLEAIEADIKCKLEKVEWLPNFYSLPPHIQIASSKSYQEGKIYGIDAASGAAVSALNISPGDHVLDLCAAPELLGNSGSVTGVDVAKHRLAACRTLLHFIPIRVHSDFKSVNREFGVEKDEFLYKEWTSRRPWKERKRANKEIKNGFLELVQDPELIYYGRCSGVVGMSKIELFKTVSSHEISQYGYDKVLVDAECTHDGSIKHIQKFENWGWSTMERRVLDAERTDDLTVLQFRLLTNGFKLLRVGGNLVYSTCRQLLVIDGSESWPCKSGRIPKTLRFDPLTSRTSGLFVAKFTKLAKDNI
ncbi:hypothetical protein Lser_V15G19546 [Lactuca serriola]